MRRPCRPNEADSNKGRRLTSCYVAQLSKRQANVNGRWPVHLTAHPISALRKDNNGVPVPRDAVSEKNSCTVRVRVCS